MKKNKIAVIIIISLALILAVFIFGVAIGSVYISPKHIINIILNSLFDVPLNDVNASGNNSVIILSFRIPRVILGFFVGASLGVSGAVVQSVLTNPLASPFTLGTSSGASFGAAIIIAFEAYFIGKFTLPLVGILCSVATIFAMILLANKLDKSFGSNTVILTGMVLSLFLSSIVTLIANIADEKYSYILRWQTGSLSGKNYFEVIVIASTLAITLLFFMFKSNELDILTFGDEQASSVGVNTKRSRFLLLIFASILSGVAVSFTGVIGFIDLISPNITRKIFGSKHILLLPLSAVIGGVFTVVCDIIARTVISPNELPIGVVTSLLGAPFFVYVYASKRKKRADNL